MEKNGGKYNPSFNKHVNVLILPKQAIGNQKHKLAVEWKRTCLLPEWIIESANIGYAKNVVDFTLKVLQPDHMSDDDSTPDLIGISPQRKIKLEKMSEPCDNIAGDETVRDSCSNSVEFIENHPEGPITIVDSEDANRQMLESLQMQLDNMTGNMDEDTCMDVEPAEPPFKQGIRYKDCDDCRMFFKEKKTKKEIVYEVPLCKQKCRGYISRKNEIQEMRELKSVLPPKVYDGTPPGFWS